MRVFIIVALLLQFSNSGYSQNTDSFSRAIDSSMNESRKRMQDLQDSMYKLDLKRSMEQNGKNLERFMADYQERQKGEKKRMYIMLGLGVAFLAVLVVGLARRRKMREKNKQ